MKKLISLFIVSFVLTSCGFQVSQNKINFKIVQIFIEGDKKINYEIKNYLLLNSQKNSLNSIKVSINTKKDKFIFEKNIKNEITKYRINITANIEIVHMQNNKQKKFTLSKLGTFNVENRNSQTINNEKKLIKLLTLDLIEEIQDKIIENTNDIKEL